MAVSVSTSDSVIDKKHESFSLLPLCDVVSLSQLVTCYQHSHHIQADMDGGFRGIQGSLAHVQLYGEVAVWSPSGPRK